MNAHRTIVDRRGRLPGVAAVGAAMTDQLVQIVAELRHLAKTGRIPALYVDGGVIRVPWPPNQAVPLEFRILSEAQAERLIDGESLESVLAYRRRQPPHQKPAPSRKPPAWIGRRAEYLARKSA